MADSSLVRRGARAAALCALYAGSLAAAPAVRIGHESDLPILVEAASSQLDYRSNMVMFRDIVVSQGATRVIADRANSTGASATGLNFDDSQWTFAGNVRISVEGGALDSDKAVVSFATSRVSKAVITGNPATFEQQLKDGRLARGRSGVIEYNVAQGTVRLTKDAWLSDGRDEMTGQLIVYDIAGERVKAQTLERDTQRVHITIHPRSAAPRSPAPSGVTPPSTPATPAP
jgi:lipopolysaccharide transport protein LptA